MGAASILRSEEAYLWDYCDTSLHISSRLALACAAGEKAYDLVVKLRHMEEYDGKSFAEFLRFVSIVNFIRCADHLSTGNSMHPNDAYLALRMLSQVISDIRFFGRLEYILEEVIDFAKAFPDAVEWEEADKMFMHLLFTARGSTLISMLKFVDYFFNAQVDQRFVK